MTWFGAHYVFAVETCFFKDWSICNVYTLNLFVHILRGVFNKFPDFFIQAFKTVIDS